MTGSRLCVERGLRYHLLLWGSERIHAPAVVLLHGFAGSAHDWAPVGEVLDRAGYRAIAIDLPGHGDSEAPADPRRYGFEETALDVGVLLDLLGAPDPHWVGYSMGGRLALYVASREARRVRSLLLESVSPGLGSEPERAARRSADEALASEIERHGVEWFAEYWEAQPIFASQRNLPDDERTQIRERRLRNRPAGLAGSLRGLGQGVQPFLEPALPAISVPTTLVTGALDAKYTTLGAAMAAAMAAARHVVVPDAGHNVHLERPDAFERALLEHLGPYVGAARSAARSTL